MTKHNFYIYSNCDFSVKSAAATRMMYYAKGISNEENAVYLVSCCSTKLEDDNFNEIEPNVFVLEQKQLTKNIIPTISFLKELCRFSDNHKGKKTYLLYPYPFVFLELFTVLYMIFIRKKTVYYELNEVRKYSSYFHDKLSIKRIKYSLKKIIYNSIYAFLDKLLPYYKGLICISTNIQKYGQVYNENTIRIPILTNPRIKIQTSSKSYVKNSSFNIGFSGSIVSNKENLDSFVDVVNKLHCENFDVTFNLCGTINTRDKQKLLTDKNQYAVVKYHGNLCENELSAFLGQQNLLVIPRGYNMQNNYGFSTKLSDYLNHQKVILLTNISDNRLYIVDGVNGYMVPPDDEKAMINKLKYIIKNYQKVSDSIIANASKTSKEEFNYQLHGPSLRGFMSKN